MTSSNDRLDRVEALLEAFVAVSVADRKASNERMTRLEQSMTASDQRMTRIEQSMDRQSRESNDRLTRIEEDREATDAKVDVLMTCINTLAVDVRQLVDYLRSQSGNGRSGG